MEQDFHEGKISHLIPEEPLPGETTIQPYIELAEELDVELKVSEESNVVELRDRLRPRGSEEARRLFESNWQQEEKRNREQLRIVRQRIAQLGQEEGGKPDLKLIQGSWKPFNEGA